MSYKTLNVLHIIKYVLGTWGRLEINLGSRELIGPTLIEQFSVVMYNIIVTL